MSLLYHPSLARSKSPKAIKNPIHAIIKAKVRAKDKLYKVQESVFSSDIGIIVPTHEQGLSPRSNQYSSWNFEAFSFRRTMIPTPIKDREQTGMTENKISKHSILDPHLAVFSN